MPGRAPAARLQTRGSPDRPGRVPDGVVLSQERYFGHVSMSRLSEASFFARSHVMMHSRPVLGILMGATPLLLSGCMMLGSAGMGHASGGVEHAHAQPAPMIGQTVIKETVVEGVRITAEFPPYAYGDNLAYRVTLRRERDSTAIGDASLAMLIGPADARDRTTRVLPSAVDSGVYVFRPVVTAIGAYRVSVRVERAGSIALTSGAELEHVVRLDARMDMSAPDGNGGGSSMRAPMALLGAGVMAVMMLVMLR